MKLREKSDNDKNNVWNENFEVKGKFKGKKKIKKEKRKEIKMIIIITNLKQFFHLNFGCFLIKTQIIISIAMRNSVYWKNTKG